MKVPLGQMAENQVVGVAAIKMITMKSTILGLIWLIPLMLSAQDKTKNNGNHPESSGTYSKRVLESSELEILTSIYGQKGSHASVTGGIGNEKLTDAATNIVVSIPLNNSDVLTIDGTVSAYSSASSSNLNPFTSTYVSSGGVIISGASRSGKGGRDNRPGTGTTKVVNTGSPWVASSGASRSDVWGSGALAYSHSSKNQNQIISGRLNFSKEFDYTSFGAGFGFVQQFNHKNTELGLQANVYLDQWDPQYPTEIHTYVETRGNLNAGFFTGVDILNQSGQISSKTLGWHPLHTTLITTNSRNTFAISLSFSQILSKKSQVSLFSDLVLQQGWLANPMQRVYFADQPNYYIGIANDIPYYTSPLNTRVFQLADDIERLPQERYKIPIGIRYHYYLSEHIVTKYYYRFYYDNWGLQAHTFQIELPVKAGKYFSFYPNYRYYTQTAARYFAPFEQHMSTDIFYTSDYDLAGFQAHQMGLGVKYTDIFTAHHISIMGIKSISLDYNHYRRSDALSANIWTLGLKFVANK